MSAVTNSNFMELLKVVRDTLVANVYPNASINFEIALNPFNTPMAIVVPMSAPESPYSNVEKLVTYEIGIFAVHADLNEKQLVEKVLAMREQIARLFRLRGGSEYLLENPSAGTQIQQWDFVGGSIEPVEFETKTFIIVPSTIKVEVIETKS